MKASTRLLSILLASSLLTAPGVSSGAITMGSPTMVNVALNRTTFGDVASRRPSPSTGGSPGIIKGEVFQGNPNSDQDGDGVNAFTEFAMGIRDLIPNTLAEMVDDQYVRIYRSLTPLTNEKLFVRVRTKYPL